MTPPPSTTARHSPVRSPRAHDCSVGAHVTARDAGVDLGLVEHAGARDAVVRDLLPGPERRRARTRRRVTTWAECGSAHGTTRTVSTRPSAGSEARQLPVTSCWACASRAESTSAGSGRVPVQVSTPTTSAATSATVAIAPSTRPGDRETPAPRPSSADPTQRQHRQHDGDRSDQQDAGDQRPDGQRLDPSARRLPARRVVRFGVAVGVGRSAQVALPAVACVSVCWTAEPVNRLAVGEERAVRGRAAAREVVGVRRVQDDLAEVDAVAAAGRSACAVHCVGGLVPDRVVGRRARARRPGHRDRARAPRPRAARRSRPRSSRSCPTRRRSSRGSRRPRRSVRSV